MRYSFLSLLLVFLLTTVACQLKPRPTEPDQQALEATRTKVAEVEIPDLIENAFRMGNQIVSSENCFMITQIGTGNEKILSLEISGQTCPDGKKVIATPLIRLQLVQKEEGSSTFAIIDPKKRKVRVGEIRLEADNNGKDKYVLERLVVARVDQVPNAPAYLEIKPLMKSTPSYYGGPATFSPSGKIQSLRTVIQPQYEPFEREKDKVTAPALPLKKGDKKEMMGPLPQSKMEIAPPPREKQADGSTKEIGPPKTDLEIAKEEAELYKTKLKELEGKYDKANTDFVKQVTDLKSQIQKLEALISTKKGP